MPPSTLVSASPGRCLAWVLLSAAPCAAWAQGASCSSDGQARPLVLLERFINADCAECWTDPATPKAAERALAIDWIVPGSRGEEAPLSAVATRDGTDRLKALGRPVPARSDVQQSRLLAAARTVRVAHGPPFNGYLGVSIELKPAGKGPWKAWLALVESLPAGTEGSPVPRNLVRNVFQPPWDLPRLPSKAEQKRLFDSRAMRIPEGADPQRLLVVGWVQDARGRIRAIAQSRCAPVSPSQ
jgi:hypothetical protein